MDVQNHSTETKPAFFMPSQDNGLTLHSIPSQINGGERRAEYMPAVDYPVEELDGHLVKDSTVQTPQRRKSYSSQDCPTPLFIIARRKNVDTRKYEYKRMRIPCNRYACPVCGDRKKRRLYGRVKEATRGKKLYFLTVTLREDKGRDMSDQWHRLMKAWNNLLAYMRKNSKVSYFRVVELQGNNTPHIHALISKRMSNKKLRKLWYAYTGDSFICRFENIRLSAASYIFKYMSKGIRDIEKIREQTGNKTKIFSWSRDFLIPLKKKPAVWEVLYFSRSAIEANLFFRSMAQRERFRAPPIARVFELWFDGILFYLEVPFLEEENI